MMSPTQKTELKSSSFISFFCISAVWKPFCMMTLAIVMKMSITDMVPYFSGPKRRASISEIKKVIS